MPKAKILIVDDEPFNVDYLQQELEELGYETVSACNGVEALESVRRDAPDLVLLDIMMPVMDGFEALARLKAEPQTRAVPVIVISANSDLRSVVRGIELGAEDYLPKPFEPALLRARLSASLEKKRLRDIEQLYLRSLQRELEIGREIQQGFLPAELPQAAGWQMASYFKSAREVAGDFYDALLLPDGDLLCVIGDVCDKGVGAALFMTLFRSLIRAAAEGGLAGAGDRTPAHAPAQRLERIMAFVNDYVAHTHAEASMFATIFICLINPRSGALTYINGGHEPPVWARSGGSVQTLARSGPAVGVISGAKFSAHQITFEPGDVLLAFTDGVPDAVDQAGARFGRAALPGIITGGGYSPAALLRQVIEQVRLFAGETEQFDDIALLAVMRDA